MAEKKILTTHIKHKCAWTSLKTLIVKSKMGLGHEEDTQEMQIIPNMQVCQSWHIRRENQIKIIIRYLSNWQK